MNKKKITWIAVAGLLSIAVIFDAIRYLKPGVENKMLVHPVDHFSVRNATEIVLVYHAWGGIYPGLVDFVRKEIFPKSYPCNLCYQTFGTFGMKPAWRHFLDSLPLKKTELHRDNFQRIYEPTDMELPAISLSTYKSSHPIERECSLLSFRKELFINAIHIDGLSAIYNADIIQNYQP